MSLTDKLRQAAQGPQQDEEEFEATDNTFRGGSVQPRPSTGGGNSSLSRKLRGAQSTGLASRLPGGQSYYDTVPPASEMEVALKTFGQIVQGEQLNPFATAQIKTRLREMASVPEAAYLLRNDKAFEDIQQAYWVNMMDAMMSGYEEDPSITSRRGRLQSSGLFQSFVAAHQKTLGPEERDLFTWILASMPDPTELLQEAGVQSHGSGPWGWFRTGLEVVIKAPEAVRPTVNDPRGQVIALANEWLSYNELRSPEDKYRFFNFIMSKAHASISEVESLKQGGVKGGFFRLAQRTVGFIPDVALNGFSDLLARSADPEGYGTRQFLSFGQNLALAAGVDPAEGHHGLVSRATDMLAQVYLDPQNLFFGFASAAKNAARIPRTVSRAEALRASLNPLGRGRIGVEALPTFDRSLTGRVWYAVLSKEGDDLVMSPQGARALKPLVNMTSASQIARRYPSLREQTALLEALAEADNITEVQQLMRAGFNGADAMQASAPLAFQRAVTARNKAIKEYTEARRARTDAADFNLADLGHGDVLRPGEAFEVVPRPVLPGNEGVVSRLERTGRRVANAASSPEVTTFSTKAGETVSVRRTGARRFDGFIDGEWVGGIDLGPTSFADPEVGTAASRRGQGIYSQMLDYVETQVPGARQQILSSPTITEAAQAATGDRLPGVLRMGALNQDGSQKAVLGVAPGRSVQERWVESTPGLQDWLTTEGHTELAARIELGHRLSGLTDEERRILVTWMQATDTDVLRMGDEVFVNPNTSALETITGVDGVVNPQTHLSNTLEREFFELNASNARFNAWRANADRNLWVVKDLPQGKRTTTGLQNFGRLLNSAAPKSFAERMRRLGFVAKHKLPKNISLTRGGQGSQELFDWIKALGGTDDLAARWADEFLRAGPTERYGIIKNALRETGDQLENPMIKYGLFQFTDKQGQYTYGFGRNGMEIGAGADGSVTPLTITHMSDTFAMPDAKGLLRSVKRYGQDSSFRLHRGLLTSTRSRRAKIVRDLKARLRRNGLADVVDALSDEDFARLAYSDVLAGALGRGQGAGMVNKAATIAASPLKVLHSTFVVAQLAFRPIAWATRVLMEETVRSDLMSMPSLWRNPFEFVGYWMDARAIRKLPELEMQAAQHATRLVDDIFLDGTLDVGKLKDLFPDLDPTNLTKADISHIIGRELFGEGIGSSRNVSRSNITSRAWLRRRRIQAHRKRIAQYESINDAFRWQIDGTEIANRSFYNDFMFEASSATTVPIEWSRTAMTPDGIATYGRAYARQTNQMLDDPLVGGYGVQRMIARLGGTDPDAAYNARRLVGSAYFRRIEPQIDKKLAADGLPPMSRLEKAQWYLDNVVDEMSETLFRPLVRNASPQDGAQLLSDLRRNKPVRVSMGDTQVTLHRTSYQTFADDFEELAAAAFQAGEELPQRISGFFDPRFGQRDAPNRFRAITDWTLQHFGENASQHLNRQPAYLATREKYYRFYRELGWDKDIATQAAAEKAAELVNFVYFDNQSIPQLLHDMNKVMPFFSAMWEVGQTWAYKIPATEIYGVGMAHLVRRIDRTLQGLVKSGLVTYDPESGQMQLNLSRDMRNAQPGAALVGRAVYEWMRVPFTTLEHLGGLANLALEGEYRTANFDSWMKDGFSLSIGNPINPFSYGLGAVNQFSVGLTPGLQLGASWLARSAFAWDDQIESTAGQTLQEYLVDHPDVDWARLVHANKDAFIAANGMETYSRFVEGVFDPNELVMPDTITVPDTAWYESLIDKTVFPFGQLNGFGELISSVSPAAMNYVWRSMFTRFGEGEDSELMAWLFGNMSNVQVGNEKILQAQMLELSEGLLTKQLDLSTQIEELVEQYGIDIATDPSGVQFVRDPNSEQARRVQYLLEQAHDLNLEIVRRIENNTAGSLFARGLMGQLGPVTPRMFVNEQNALAQFWAGKDLATEIADARGNPDFAKAVVAGNVRSVDDMSRLGATLQQWIADPTGDYAKAWLRDSNPAMLAMLGGKTYYGDVGFYPEVKGFDQWADDVESGVRKPVPVEVFIQRYQRASIAADKMIDIIENYGNDPAVASTLILHNWEQYKDITEPYNMRYDGLEYLDKYVYDGAYTAWQGRDGMDNLSLYSLLEQRHRDIQSVVDDFLDMLKYTDLDPQEESQVRGALSAAIAEQGNVFRQLQELGEEDATWRNPLEDAIARYFVDISNPYYEERNRLYDEYVATAQTTAEQSAAFEILRQFDNDAFAQDYRLKVGDTVVSVPSPMERSWNGKSDEERLNKMLANIGKNAAWLNDFEVEVLKEQSPEAAEYLPTPASMEVRARYAEAAKQVLDQGRAAGIESAKINRALEELDDARREDIASIGRVGELFYEDAVPFQRIEMIGLLPANLQPIAPMVNQILADLRAQDKSPTTNQGDLAFLQLVQFLETDFFRSNPQARVDMMQLGKTMFGESLPAAVYARLLQGAYPFNPKLEG